MALPRFPLLHKRFCLHNRQIFGFKQSGPGSKRANQEHQELALLNLHQGCQQLANSPRFGMGSPPHSDPEEIYFLFARGHQLDYHTAAVRFWRPAMPLSTQSVFIRFWQRLTLGAPNAFDGWQWWWPTWCRLVQNSPSHCHCPIPGSGTTRCGNCQASSCEIDLQHGHGYSRSHLPPQNPTRPLANNSPIPKTQTQT